MKNLITQEQAAKKNPAILKRLLGLSLADLTKLHELHERKCDEHRHQIDYVLNTENANKLNGAIEKTEELEIITLLLREALDIRYANIFKDKINIPSDKKQLVRTNSSLKKQKGNPEVSVDLLL